MNFKVFATLLAAAAIAVSCASVKNISYFQDLDESGMDSLATPRPIIIRPDDRIAIIVNCRDQQIANMFNLPYTSRMLGQPNEYISSYSQGVLCYQVRPDGTIDFPELGSVEVAGMTRAEIAAKIKSELEGRSLVKNPVVTVEFTNLTVQVMGEVTRPGRFNIDKDCYTILDALSAAGDLTIYGLRENVKVTRTGDDGQKKTYSVNLCSAKDVYSSPVFYMQQNDVIYVEPNKVRARQSTVNGNNLLSTSFWMSVASLAVTISYYFFK